MVTKRSCQAIKIGFSIFPSIFKQTVEKNLGRKIVTKELSFCHKLWFSKFNIVATQCGRPLIFQTMNAVGLNNVSVKYQRFK